ncbi:MAG: hypothetical protein AAGJ46_12200 [Planctomycetota bacterium]
MPGFDDHSQRRISRAVRGFERLNKGRPQKGKRTWPGGGSVIVGSASPSPSQAIEIEPVIVVSSPFVSSVQSALPFNVVRGWVRVVRLLETSAITTFEDGHQSVGLQAEGFTVEHLGTNTHTFNGTGGAGGILTELAVPEHGVGDLIVVWEFRANSSDAIFEASSPRGTLPFPIVASDKRNAEGGDQEVRVYWHRVTGSPLSAGVLMNGLGAGEEAGVIAVSAYRNVHSVRVDAAVEDEAQWPGVGVLNPNELILRGAIRDSFTWPLGGSQVGDNASVGPLLVESPNGGSPERHGVVVYDTLQEDEETIDPFSILGGPTTPGAYLVLTPRRSRTVGYPSAQPYSLPTGKALLGEVEYNTQTGQRKLAWLDFIEQAFDYPTPVEPVT